MEIQVSDRPTGRLRRLLATLRRAGVALPAVLVLAGLAGVGVLFLGGGSDKPKGPPDTDPSLTPAAAQRAARKQERARGGHVVRLAGVGAQAEAKRNPADGAARP